MNSDWLAEAAQRYEQCIRDTLTWMLHRRPSENGFVDTKHNPLTGQDYQQHSGLRGPDFTYGWIQGRGLEALVAFTRYYEDIDKALSRQLNDAAFALYEGLRELYERDGHIYFLYDKALKPIRPENDNIRKQNPAGSIFTYSDAFAAKGLFAAACHFNSTSADKYRDYLLDVVAAVETHRFQMNEAIEISREQAQSEADDYGPRMILLGASGVLHHHEQSDHTAFADRFIDDVLNRYLDSASGLLQNVPGQDTCNVGHGIEFCGFAFEHLRGSTGDSRIKALSSILERSLEIGLQGPGIALSVSTTTGKAVSPYYPWWPLPEAIRACALESELTGSTHLNSLWIQADTAFFENYWQAPRSVAYQTRTLEGPVDFVPATPDLDPGYHTGLSLLAAMNTIRKLRSAPAQTSTPTLG